MGMSQTPIPSHAAADGVTLELVGGLLQIKDGGVSGAKLASGAIIYSKLSGASKYLLHNIVAAAADHTFSATADLTTNFNLYKDVTINAGVTLTCTQKITFLVCKSLTLSGTSVLTTAAAGAAGGAGVSGNAAGNAGTAGFNGAGSGGGGHEGNNSGAGGASDLLAGGAAVAPLSGGAAAAYGIYDAKRLIQIFSPFGLLQVVATETLYGSGGGSGSVASGGGGTAVSGTAGKGAGTLIIFCETLTNAGLITAPGSNAAASSSSAGGGWGGAGGSAGGSAGAIVIINTSSCSGAGSVTAPGGNGANASGTGAGGGGGAGGNGGRVDIFSPTAANPFTISAAGGTHGNLVSPGANGADGNAGVAAYYALDS